MDRVVVLRDGLVVPETIYEIQTHPARSDDTPVESDTYYVAQGPHRREFGVLRWRYASPFPEHLTRSAAAQKLREHRKRSV